MHMALLLQKSRFHRKQVVSLALFEFRITFSQKGILELQIIVGVIFIADGHRHQIYGLEVFGKTSSAGKAEHLDQTFLEYGR